MKRRELLATLGLLATGSSFSALGAPAGTGIVLLHGKQSRPNDVADIASSLRSAGYAVAVPEMAWSQRREYDVPYPQALEEVAAAAQSLGAAHLVVGGHSLGANAALAYVASGHAADAVFALSPGHVPEGPGFRRETGEGVRKAREMVARGEGGEKAWFPDANQGRTREVRTTAAAYLSYFDPRGLGSMGQSARSFPKPIPLFMAVGSSEGILPYARDGIFGAAPKTDKSLFVEVPGDHFGAPRNAVPQLLQWLAAVSA